LGKGGHAVPSIQFSAQETNDSRSYTVAFPALVNGKQVECAIPYQALWRHFGADYVDPLPAFTIHRPHIEQLAVQFIKQQRFESDGTILIRSYDI
jgi:Protein of unknown function (DUF1488)